MNAKIRILCAEGATIVELCGKTIGRGVESVNFHHDGNGDTKINLSIDLENFAFMPDGYFDEVTKKVAEAKPPEDHLVGRA